MKFGSALRTAVAVALFAPAAAIASPVLIDNFSTAQTVFTPPNPTTDSVATGASAIGTNRDVTVSASSGFPSGIIIDGGAAQIGYGPTTSGFVDLDWGTFSASDFTGGGMNNSVGISVLSADSSVMFQFTVQSTSGTGSYTRTANGAEDLYFLFSGFSGTVNFAEVTGISLRISGGDAFDTGFDLVQATEDPNNPIPVIPLPAGAWLMIGGMGAFAAIKRRKQKQV